MNKTTSYTGTYKGVSWEAKTWEMRDITSIDPEEMKDNWTYYLYIDINRIPEESNPGNYWLKAEEWKISPDSQPRIKYNEYESPLGGLYWHGGITWYSKESTADEESIGQRVIKAGCDYQHYGDDNPHMTIEDILPDIHRTINSFREQVPGYKYRCSYNGKLYDISEGKVNEDGSSFISNEGIQQRLGSGYKLADWMQ